VVAAAPAAVTDGLDDLYRVLQVEPSADLESIHAAYRRLARLYHPDLNPDPEAAPRMRAINAAYRVLSDPLRRARYDSQRFLKRPQLGVRAPTATATRTATQTRARVVVVPPPDPPTALQRRVDRIVAVLGILLIIGIGAYSLWVIPRAEANFQRTLRGGQASAPVSAERPSAGGTPQPRPTGADVAARLRGDDALRSFPKSGAVLVPPANLAPFKDLPVLRIDESSQGIVRYAVYFGDLTTGVASISGQVGKTTFDAAAPKLPDCAPDATYCAGPNAGQSASDPPGLELFRPPDLVADYPSFAVHRVCCNGVFWSLSWYEPATDMSYTIDLSRTVAMQFGSSAADDDEVAARAVGALAAQLVRLT
jgi:hypothetical protein